MPILPTLVRLALEHCEPFPFERYSQAVFATTIGHTFKPLGGQNDGGADGFIDSDLKVHSSRAHFFFQASKEIDVSGKIKRTITRLKEVGRQPKTLYFASSRVVARIDELQDSLTDELDVIIRIYDRNYFEVHANDSPTVVASFEENLRSSVAFITEGIGPSFPEMGIASSHREVSAFLGQEVNRRAGTTKTLESVCDALILWALEGTDPAGVMMTAEDITSKVENVIPSARVFFRGEVVNRLRKMSSKSGGQRQINVYAKQGLYCLPLESRKQLEQYTVEEEALKLSVSSSFESRISSDGRLGSDSPLVRKLVQVLHRTLESVFDQQGFDISNHFLGDPSMHNKVESRPIIEIAENELGKINTHGHKLSDLSMILRTVLRDVFYRSSPSERMYLGRLSRTYMLLFTIRNTPEVINFFNTMSKNFRLYIGSDLIIRAISEYFLSPEDQITVNAIKIIKNAGSTILLSESMLEEVHSHIYAAHLEYTNYYLEIDNIVDVALASQCDRILIRAYYYAKLGTTSYNKPVSWDQYLNNFVTASKLSAPKSAQSMASLRATLCNRFGLKFETRTETEEGVIKSEAKILSNKIRDMRPHYKKEELADNDAKLILRVDHLRKKHNEASGNPFGFNPLYSPGFGWRRVLS